MLVVRGLGIVLRPAPARLAISHRTAFTASSPRRIALASTASATSVTLRAAHPSVLPLDSQTKHRRGITMVQAVVANVAPAGEIKLDRASFTEIVHLKALRVPTARCQELMKKFSGFTFRQPRTRCVVRDGDNKATRLMLLADTIKGDGLEGLREDLKKMVKEDGLEVTEHAQELDYSYWPADHILRKLLPEGSEVPSSFESIGHIAHLNIRDELLLYKGVIGQVIMEKNPHIKTVVNKVGNIKNEYRVFDMEVLAGENNLLTEVMQYKARFQLDFSKVYWNSRLESEHKRLVDTFESGQIICDIMAGIGPFAVPAAQKGCKVFANDLNPDSFLYLQKNTHLNKVSNKVQMFNMDGREFIKLMCGPPKPSAAAAAAAAAAVLAADSGAASAPGSATTASQAAVSGGVFFQHAIMNLPASAVEFLDAFNGAFDPVVWAGKALPMIHCYTFSKALTEDEGGVRARVEAALGGPLDTAPAIHTVRDVAPNKRMLCVSFQLPASIAFSKQGATTVGVASSPSAERPSDAEQVPSKRQRTSPA